MKKLKIFGILVLTIMVLSACGGDTSTESASGKSSNNEKYELKLIHGYNTELIIHKIVEKYDEMLQERSDGRLSLDIYPNAQVTPVNQQASSILNGLADMSISVHSVLQNVEPKYQVYDLPFLFESDPEDVSVNLNDVKAFFDHENGGKVIDREFEKHGFKVLGNTVTSAPPILLTRHKEDFVTDLDSIKGLKTRILGGKVFPKTFEALGASGVSVPSSEMVAAMQQGVIDASLNPPMSAIAYQLPFETATFLPFIQYGTPVYISQEKFDSLPADLQEILVETGEELFDISAELVIERNIGLDEKLEEMGVKTHYPTEEEMEEWREATSGVYDWFTENVEGGQELIDAAMED